jgi:glycosyltransferase involved in cell wall biosynthesis
MYETADFGSLRPDNNPQVSWLVCSNDAEPALRIALKSCLDQTFGDFEVIFVANGAQHCYIADLVSAWFADDARVKVFSTPIQGLTFSLNYGLHHARGDLIARIVSDDIAEPDRLAVQVAYMRRYADTLVLGTAYKVIDNDGMLLRTIMHPTSDAAIRRALIWKNPLCHPSVMFRCQEVRQAGGYMGGRYAEDYDLWVRMCSKPGPVFHNLEYAGVSYRSKGGEARGAAIAYYSQAGTQVQIFLSTFNFLWLLGALSSWIKSLFAR